VTTPLGKCAEHSDVTRSAHKQDSEYLIVLNPDRGRGFPGEREVTKYANVHADGIVRKRTAEPARVGVKSQTEAFERIGGTRAYGRLGVSLPREEFRLG